MSDDLTKKLPGGNDDDSAKTEDRLDLLIKMVQTLSGEFQDFKIRLEKLEQTVSTRLYETKPLWERALAEIVETRAELAETRTEMRETLHKFGLKINQLVDDVFILRSEQSDLDKRVDKLESKSS